LTCQDQHALFPAAQRTDMKRYDIISVDARFPAK
jgi:hypothetical protein